MTDRLVPLADAPPPSAAEPKAGHDQETAAAPVEGAFAPDPLNTLKLQPALVEAVSKVFDPEIPVNIYELGLVYNLDVDSNMNVQVRMTLTAPACPAAQTLPIDVERRVRDVPGVNDVKVKVVWDPPWTREKMSEAAKLSLGLD
jgi:FeS assembly SUF system protein